MIPAKNFTTMILVNVDNDKMTDADFRQFIRNTLPIIEKEPIETIVNGELREKAKKYY